MLEQYEALRRRATRGYKAGHGMAVFQHRGMAAWIAALTALGRVPSSSSVSTPSARTLSVPEALHAELTTVLADMVCACYQEVADEYQQ